MRDRRVQRVQLVLHEEFPVRMLNDAVTHRDDLDFALRRAVAHVIEGDARIAQKFRERRTLACETCEYEAAVTLDPGGALHRAIRVRRVHPRPFIPLRQWYSSDAAVEVKAPRVVRAHKT